jgi:hypothetical protein
VVGAGVIAQRGERLSHDETFPLGDHPLGLFDHDAAVEGVLQLFVQDLGLVRFSLLKDGDGGDIS